MSAKRFPATKTMPFYALSSVEANSGLGRSIDWEAVLLRQGAWALDDIEYTPVIEDGYPVLKMYKPAEIAFGSTLDEPGQPPRDVSDDDEKALGRFRETSAAIFLAEGRLVAIIKGGRSAPSTKALEAYLDNAVPLDRGQRWNTMPYRMASDAKRLRDEVTGVLSFKTRVITTRGVFDTDETDVGMHRAADSLSDETGADLRVDVGVNFDESPTSEQKRSLASVARRMFNRQDISTRYSGTTLQAEIGGEIETLVLEAHALKKPVPVPRSAGGSVPRFTDLLTSAIRVVQDTDAEVRFDLED